MQIVDLFPIPTPLMKIPFFYVYFATTFLTKISVIANISSNSHSTLDNNESHFQNLKMWDKSLKYLKQGIINGKLNDDFEDPRTYFFADKVYFWVEKIEMSDEMRCYPLNISFDHLNLISHLCLKFYAHPESCKSFSFF